MKSCHVHSLREYSAATPHFGTRSLLYFLYSKHCDRSMPCDEERHLWRNLCARLLYFVVCDVYDVVVKKFTFAISSPDELLVNDG